MTDKCKDACVSIFIGIAIPIICIILPLGAIYLGQIVHQIMK